MVRPQDPTDNATPSGWTATTQALLTYAALTGSDRHRTAAEESLGLLVRLVGSHPRFAGLGARGRRGLARRPARGGGGGGDPADPALRGAAAAYGAALRPRPGVGARCRAARVRPPAARRAALLVAAGAAAYVCRHFTCDAPLTDPGALAAALGARTP